MMMQAVTISTRMQGHALAVKTEEDVMEVSRVDGLSHA